MKNIKSKLNRKNIIFAIFVILIIKFVFGEILSLYKYYTAPSFIKEFSVEDALHDYDYMWKRLEENYPYFQVAERVLQLDINEIKLSYRNKIAEKSSISFDEFYDIIFNCSREFKEVGHFTVLPSGSYKMLKNSFESLSNAIDSEYHDFLYTKLIDDKTISAYDYLYKPELIHLLSKISIKPPNNIIIKEIDEETVYLQINSIWQDNVDNDTEILMNFFEENKLKKNIIIDMRKSGGGSDYYWSNNIVAPNIDKAISSNYKVLFKNTMQNREVLNMVGGDYVEGLDGLKELPEFDFHSFDENTIVRNSSFAVEPLYDKKILSGDIFVLIDDSTYSSEEGFAYFCKSTGFATLIGQPSDGDGPGINPFYDILPRSGLIFVYRISYTLNPDGSCNAEIGTKPDFYSHSGENVLDAAIRIISEN